MTDLINENSQAERLFDSLASSVVNLIARKLADEKLSFFEDRTKG